MKNLIIGLLFVGSMSFAQTQVPIKIKSYVSVMQASLNTQGGVVTAISPDKTQANPVTAATAEQIAEIEKNLNIKAAKQGRAVVLGYTAIISDNQGKSETDSKKWHKETISEWVQIIPESDPDLFNKILEFYEGAGEWLGPKQQEYVEKNYPDATPN